MRTTAVLAGLALAISACGGGDPADEPTTGADEPTTGAEETTAAEPTATTAAPTGTATAEPTGTATSTEVDAAGLGDGTFTIARILPESGGLEFLGGPMINAAQMAVADMNDAGGVLGADVALLEYDSGTAGDIATTNLRSALAEGADVIVGAASSAATLAMLQTLNQNGIPNCSGSTTSGDFNTDPNAGLFFRTVPPDQFVAPIVGSTILGDQKGANVAIARIQDAYGDFLAEEATTAITNAGGSVGVNVAYPADETQFDTQANEIIASQPTAVFIIGFAEAGGLIKALVEGGIDPANLYGADGIFSAALPEVSGVNIDGMTVIGAAGSEEFNQRLTDAGVDELLYGGQVYDCTILMGLWALAEGNDDVTNWSGDTLLALTQDGEKCTDFAACAELIEAGTDIDYDGESGGIALASAEGGALGNPTEANYTVARFEEGVLTTVTTIPTTIS